VGVNQNLLPIRILASVGVGHATRPNERKRSNVFLREKHSYIAIGKRELRNGTGGNDCSTRRSGTVGGQKSSVVLKMERVREKRPGKRKEGGKGRLTGKKNLTNVTPI